MRGFDFANTTLARISDEKIECWCNVGSIWKIPIYFFKGRDEERWSLEIIDFLSIIDREISRSNRVTNRFGSKGRDIRLPRFPPCPAIRYKFFNASYYPWATR